MGAKMTEGVIKFNGFAAAVAKFAIVRVPDPALMTYDVEPFSTPSANFGTGIVNGAAVWALHFLAAIRFS